MTSPLASLLGSARLAGTLLACALVAGCAGMPATPERAVEGTEVLTWQAPSGRVVALCAGQVGAPRVILVHGTPGSATSWSRYLRQPPAGLELIALDRPGFGASQPRGALPALSDQVAALEPLLVQRGGRWPVLVGHSLGGPIVLRAAAQHPERVGALVVLAGNLDPRLERLRWYNHLGTLLSPLLSRSLRNSNRELGPQRRELEALEPLLEHVRCPVIIMHGTEDDLVPYENAVYLQGRLVSAQVELRTLEGIDHFFVWSHPDEVRAAIEDAARLAAGPIRGG